MNSSCINNLRAGDTLIFKETFGNVELFSGKVIEQEHRDSVNKYPLIQVDYIGKVHFNPYYFTAVKIIKNK